MALVLARVETIRPGDRLYVKRTGRLLPVEAIEDNGSGELVIHWKVSPRDLGSFAPMRRGERWPVERGDARRALTSSARGEPAKGSSAAGPARAPSSSPISDARARALAGVLAGFRWPGRESISQLAPRQRKAAEQAARFALESLSVVE